MLRLQKSVPFTIAVVCLFTSMAVRADGPLSTPESIAKAMSQTVDYRFDQTPFRDALAQIADRHQLEIWLDEKALAGAQFDTKQSVTFAMSGVPLRTVFHYLVTHVGLAAYLRHHPGRDGGGYVVTTPEVGDDHERNKIVPDTPEWRMEEIRQKLEKLTEVEFIDTPLRDALDFLEELHQTEIWIDEVSIIKAKVATDEPVNLTLSGVTLGSALNLILEPIGLTYFIEDEVLKITSKEAASEKLETRVYEVSKLVDADQTAAELARVISTTVQPKTWTCQGGKGTIDSLREAIVVSQTQAIHGEIAKLLKQLPPHRQQKPKETVPVPFTTY